MPIERLITIVFIVLVTLGGAWQYRNLNAEINRLENENQTLNQKREALSDSIDLVGEYVADSVKREVLEKVQTPADPETLRVPVPVEEQAEEGVSETTETKISIGQDSISGISKGVRNAAREWAHSINKEVGLYNLDVQLYVKEPGDSVEYNASVSTDAFEIGLYGYEDEEGVIQTSIDVPSSLNVEDLQSTYTKPSVQQNQNVYFHAPIFLAAPPVITLRGGTAVSYETELLFGTEFNIKGGLYVPVFETDSPTFLPIMETSIKF